MCCRRGILTRTNVLDDLGLRLNLLLFSEEYEFCCKKKGRGVV